MEARPNYLTRRPTKVRSGEAQAVVANWADRAGSRGPEGRSRPGRWNWAGGGGNRRVPALEVGEARCEK
jgi:hypothetical protein